LKNAYEFDPINRLTKATNASGQTASYDYNGLGFRVGKQITDSLNPTKHISYVLDLTRQYHNMLQMSDDTQTQSYAWDGNAAFADGNAYLQDELVKAQSTSCRNMPRQKTQIGCLYVNGCGNGGTVTTFNILSMVSKWRTHDIYLSSSQR